MEISASQIQGRRKKLEQDISDLMKRIEDKKTELSELEIAERVFRSLSAPSTVDGRSSKPRTPVYAQTPAVEKYSAPSTPTLTVRQIIFEALKVAQQQGKPGLAPKDFREYAREKYGRDIGPQANTVSSRMWRDAKEIDKNVETGLFSLLPRNEDADRNLGRDTSAPSLFQPPAKDREAGSGGGP